jgi:hypothetical protein
MTDMDAVAWTAILVGVMVVLLTVAILHPEVTECAVDRGLESWHEERLYTVQLMWKRCISRLAGP